LKASKQNPGSADGPIRTPAVHASEPVRISPPRGRRPGPLDDVDDEIAAGGGRAVTVSADVGAAEGSARALTSAMAAFGRLDTLVCNHGVGTSAAVGDDTPEG
jgi:NAD(P)-dependent dehydrogenase (short-subunit alcohol dehydrogenase family)